jgi:hypothetical protein
MFLCCLINNSTILLYLIKFTIIRNGRNKGCTLLNVAVFFTILCGDTALGEKYRKLLHLISDHNSCIQRLANIKSHTSKSLNLTV